MTLIIKLWLISLSTLFICAITEEAQIEHQIIVEDFDEVEPNSSAQNFQNSLVDSQLQGKLPVDTGSVTVKEFECHSGEECRVIFVYTEMNKCKLSESWNQLINFKESFESHGLVSSPERELHRQIMRLFEQRVNEVLEKGTESLRNSRGQKSSIASSGRDYGLNTYIEDDEKVYKFRINEIGEVLDNTMSANGVTYDQNSLNNGGNGMSVRIKTRYLQSLSMEIAVVPEPLTAYDAISLSEDLPCVDFVSPDFVKIIPPQKESIVYELPKNLSPSRTKIEIDSIEKSSNTVSSSLEGDSEIEAPMDGFLARFMRRVGQEIGSPYSRPPMSTSTRKPNQTILHRKDDFLNNEEEKDTVNQPPNNKTVSKIPSDPLFPYQWHLQNISILQQNSIRTLQDLKDSSKIIIAVLDSGCDLRHPDLVNQYWKNPDEICDDGIDNDKNGYIDDCYGWDFVENDPLPNSDGNGHGTAAAGIIAAASDNGIGVTGLCWNCKIMCLRFIKGIHGKTTDQIAALDYAIAKKVKISNNSYGGYGATTAEYRAVERAQKQGHLFSTSAGNKNKNTDNLKYSHTPSSYNLDNILSVGAHDQKGKKAEFSNYGEHSVDILAPGKEIVTTYDDGSYAIVSGTSFSAPVGAGTAGIIWSQFPELNYTDVIAAVVSSCTLNTSENYKFTRCHGILNVLDALEKAEEISKHLQEKPVLE